MYKNISLISKLEKKKKKKTPDLNHFDKTLRNSLSFICGQCLTPKMDHINKKLKKKVD